MGKYLTDIVSYIENSTLKQSNDWALLQGALHYLLPILAFWIVFRCSRALLTYRSRPGLWAWLRIEGIGRYAITHWENMLGSGKNCDLIVTDNGLNENHAVITRYDDGSWSVTDVGGQGEIYLSGKEYSAFSPEIGEVFEIGRLSCVIEEVTTGELKEYNRKHIIKYRNYHPGFTMALLTVFLLFGYLMLFDSLGENNASALQVFLLLSIAAWCFYGVNRFFRWKGSELEILAFFLCTVGLFMIASVSPAQLQKELAALLLGAGLYAVLFFVLRSLDRAKKLRYLAVVFGLLLLAVNIIFGTIQNGARNWIYIGSISVQPSEIVKLCFIFAGTSTLDRIASKRNLLLFVVYSGIICLALAYISDFGSALVFFVVFLVIGYMRSGSFASVLLVCMTVAYMATIVLSFRPYIAERFEAWGHVWEYSNVPGGYQQTRSMMCIAAGGLWGLGPGKGFLKYVAASDTDLVFATIAEEWGLLLSLAAVLAVIVIALYSIRTSYSTRSTFYSIASCAGAMVLLIQTILNVFGTVDILPLTGVTFPFVSNGGSSMLACWGILSFIRISDSRLDINMVMRSIRRENEE